MSKFYFLLILATMIESCSRDPNNSNSNNTSLADGTVQYKVNGNLVTIHNVDITGNEYVYFIKQPPGTTIPNVQYMLNAVKQPNDNFVLDVESDSLQLGNYLYEIKPSSFSAPFAGVGYNGQGSALSYDGDNIKINITSYANGLISGSFTAKFTPILANGDIDYSKKGTTLITEGVFKNIRCTY
jgi:hypothetical protein